MMRLNGVNDGRRLAGCPIAYLLHAGTSLTSLRVRLRSDAEKSRERRRESLRWSGGSKRKNDGDLLALFARGRVGS